MFDAYFKENEIDEELKKSHEENTKMWLSYFQELQSEHIKALKKQNEELKEKTKNLDYSKIKKPKKLSRWKYNRLMNKIGKENKNGNSL